jgi:hypothetical protein
MSAASEAIALPEGVALAPGEQVLGTGRFSVSNLLFFIHWTMFVTNKRIIGRVPNTILAIIPLGFSQVSYPLANVAGVAVRRAYSALAFVLGILFVLGGISGRSPIAIFIGVVLLLAAFRNNIQITNSGGDRIRHAVSFLDRAAAEAFVQEVNTAIATHAHGSSVSQAPSPAPPAAAAASEALAELKRLSDLGYLTPEEFDAKRREIIGRI